MNFATSPDAYTIYVEPDLRMDVARVQTKHSEDSRESYMWIQAVQGFFVLYQDLRETRSSSWQLIFEIIPESFSSSFFPWVEDEFFSLLPEWQKVDSPSLDNTGGDGSPPLNSGGE